MPELSKYGELELTSKERTAFSRLSDNKDFHAFVDVMTRWQIKRAHDLIERPEDDQAAQLLQHQGGYALLKRMVKYVNESIGTTKN